MKSKLLAIAATIVLLTACQSGQINEEIPQNAGDIETEITEPAMQTPDSEVDASEKEDPAIDEEEATNVLTPEAGIEASQEESATGDPLEDGYEVAALPPEDLEQMEAKKHYGAIYESAIADGIVEASARVLEISKGFNAETLQKKTFEGLYETYWIQEGPYDSLSAVRQELLAYFTEECADDLIDLWGLVEVDGQLYAPERSKVYDIDLDSIVVNTAEVSDTEERRYINFNFTDAYGQEQSSLILLKRRDQDQWKMDTIPGTGIVQRYGNSFIRDVYWMSGAVTWSWPEFISNEDRTWSAPLSELKKGVEAEIASKMTGFVPDVAFSRIGARQLSYWVDWEYVEDSSAYPHLNVTLSEYMKYGIHPNHTRWTVTLDRASGKAVKLDQLSTEWDAFEEAVNMYIDGYMMAHAEEFYNDTVFEGIDENTQFYLTDDGIAFYFQLYEYAPYAFGYPVIEVPAGLVEDYLSEPMRAYYESKSQTTAE